MATNVKILGAKDKLIELPNGLFIDNEFVPSLTGNTITTTNPYSNESLATLWAASQQDVDIAVGSSRKAFDTVWKATASHIRSELLLKLSNLIERDASELASLEALDGGILYHDSMTLNIPNAIATLRYYAGWADKIDGKSLRIPEGMAYTLRNPIGVCAAIVPWNGPLMITIWKLAPAIAAGNTLIIKTAELTPLYGLKLGLLIAEAGFPPGVINILTGLGSVAGAALAEHMDVRKISFTGSGLVGRNIMIAAAKSNLKKVTLELGGKSASIVFDDADLSNAIFWSSIGITANNGQICAAGSRIYVQAGVYEKFLEGFRDAIGQSVPGNPLHEGVTKGPIASHQQQLRVMSYIEDGLKTGAAQLNGSKPNGLPIDGPFIANTAFVDVSEHASVMKEEIFGPVACISCFETEAEVILKANSSEYGLSAAVFTSNVCRAARVSDALETGQVTVNMWGALSPNSPFGGVKQSGFGRDLGEGALDEWTSLKTVKYRI